VGRIVAFNWVLGAQRQVRRPGPAGATGQLHGQPGRCGDRERGGPNPAGGRDPPVQLQR